MAVYAESDSVIDAFFTGWFSVILTSDRFLTEPLSPIPGAIFTLI